MSKTEKVKSKSVPGKNGGARPGAGRPKGKLSPKTIEKLAVKKAFEDRVAKNANSLFNAQITVAHGAQYLFKRYKVGKGWSKFERVTDPEEMAEYLDGDFAEDKDRVYYMLTAEKPDVRAIDSLLDRAFGRAPQNLNIKDDRPDPIAAILQHFGLIEGDTDAEQTEDSES